MQTAVYLFAPAPLGNKVLDRGKRRPFFLPPVYTSLFRAALRAIAPTTTTIVTKLGSRLRV